jgi:hypothetical protein
MKYICLGYIDLKEFETLPESEREAMMDDCLSYDDVLRGNGHFSGGEGCRRPTAR